MSLEGKEPDKRFGSLSTSRRTLFQDVSLHFLASFLWMRRARACGWEGTHRHVSRSYLINGRKKEKKEKKNGGHSFFLVSAPNFNRVLLRSAGVRIVLCLTPSVRVSGMKHPNGRLMSDKTATICTKKDL